MPTIPPFEASTAKKSLHTLWNRKIYEFLRDFFSTVAMAPATRYDEMGNPEIVRKPGTGLGWEIPYIENGGQNGSGYDGMFAIQDDTTYNESTAATTFSISITGGVAHVNGQEVAVDPFSETTSIGRDYYLVAALGDEGSAEEGNLIAFLSPLVAGTYTECPQDYTVRARLRIGSVDPADGMPNIVQDYLAGSSNQLIIGERCD